MPSDRDTIASDDWESAEEQRQGPRWRTVAEAATVNSGRDQRVGNNRLVSANGDREASNRDSDGERRQGPRCPCHWRTATGAETVDSGRDDGGK